MHEVSSSLTQKSCWCDSVHLCSLADIKINNPLIYINSPIGDIYFMTLGCARCGAQRWQMFIFTRTTTCYFYDVHGCEAENPLQRYQKTR